MAKRLLTNLPAIRRADNSQGLLITPYQAPTGLVGWLKLLMAMRKNDLVLMNCAAPDLLKVCLARRLLIGQCAQIISLDTVLPIPKEDTPKQRFKLAVVRWLFQQPTLFIEYFRKTEGYTRHYRISRDKFVYVPFKVNGYDTIQQIRPRDRGYIFCGGNTRRDFNSLIEAARHIEHPFRIVTMGDDEIAKHGSSLSLADRPSNVEVIRHDGDRRSFLEHIAGASLVVLPVLKGNISATGISVYLSSMALGKCVIISSGPAVDDVLPDEAAITVPPEDVEQLTQAISNLMADKRLRQSTAAAGKAYAESLGSEEQLYHNIIQEMKLLLG